MRLLLALLFAVPALAQNPLLQALPSNTALDLGKYTCDQPQCCGLCLTNCGTITDYSGFQYDPWNHQILMWGGGHSATGRTDIDRFDFDTLRWESMYPSTLTAEMTLSNADTVHGAWLSTGHPISAHSYDTMVIVPPSEDHPLGQFVKMAGGGYAQNLCGPTATQWQSVIGKTVFHAHYDLATDQWSYPTRKVESWSSGDGNAEYDPVSGLIIIVSTKGLWTYDVESGLPCVKRLGFSKAMSYSQNLVFYPPNEKLYWIGNLSGGTVWEITLNRSNWIASTVLKMPIPSGDIPVGVKETGFAYDPDTETLGGGVTAGVFYQFHPPTNSWRKQIMQISPDQSLCYPNCRTTIGSVAFHALAFDPVDGVFIFLTGNGSGRHTWAYRP